MSANEIEEAEEDNPRSEQQDVQKVPGRKRQGNLLEPLHARRLPKPLGDGRRRQK